MSTHTERHIARLYLIIQGRYIQRDQPVPLHLLAELQTYGIYFDTLEQDDDE